MFIKNDRKNWESSKSTNIGFFYIWQKYVDIISWEFFLSLD